MMIKENKIKVIISYVVALLPMLVGICFWDKIGSGSDSVLRSVRIMATFVIPSFMLVLNTLLVIVESYQFKKRRQNKKIIAMMLFIAPMISLYTSLIFYSIILGWDISIQLMTSLLLGALFIIMGNYMPKSKQNRTFGLKIRWTLANEDNWNATHRMAGKLWVACGIVMILTSFLGLFWLFMVVALVMALVPVMYSYVLHRKGI